MELKDQVNLLSILYVSTTIMVMEKTLDYVNRSIGYDEYCREIYTLTRMGHAVYLSYQAGMKKLNKNL